MNRFMSLICSVAFVGLSFAQTVFPNGFVGIRINKNGDVCGSFRATPGGVTLPCIFHNDGSSTLLPLLPNTVKGIVNDINNLGVCIGTLENANGQQTGCYWDSNHVPSISMNPLNEMPRAINDANYVVYGPYITGVTEDNCYFGQTSLGYPTYWCPEAESLPNAPLPTRNGMYISGMHQNNGIEVFSVNGAYEGAWRADIVNGSILWHNFGAGRTIGVSEAATHDHYDVFGYEGRVGSVNGVSLRNAVIWHPRVVLSDGNEHYGENVYLNNALEIRDSSTGNPNLNIPSLRLIYRPDGRYETRRIVKAADMNGDGRVDNFDIDPFIGSLGYIAPNNPNYPGTRMFPDFPVPVQFTDFNGDGIVNFYDVDLFIEELFGS